MSISNYNHHREYFFIYPTVYEKDMEVVTFEVPVNKF